MNTDCLKKLETLAVILPLLCQKSYAAENTLRNLSFGIVYPSGTTAVMESPAILSISSGDQLEFFYGLPYVYDKTT
ncbi:MAG: hypothetical protein HQK54_12140, partial [Oligoflexales bacterium]|nr:hypothetical protein [Oligoflexales bacterium]